MKCEVFTAVCILAILLTVECVYAVDMPVEMSISRRMSIHHSSLPNGGYATTAIPLSDLSKVLWAAYGKTETGRTVTTFTNYPIKIYVANITATYKFVPETSSLSLWKTGDYRSLGRGYGLAAPYQLYIIFDTNIGGTSWNDLLYGSAEAGCAMQNIYLMANTLNLGTVCQAIRTNVTEGLDLPLNEKPLYKMPLGYLTSPYTDYQNLVMETRPSSAVLPMIQDSPITLETALNQVSSSHQWANTNPLTKQELSQILWASYGYSYYNDTSTNPPRVHRTVPSAFNYYPMHIYAVNSSAVYEYIPLTHTLTTVVTGDRRGKAASASGITWAASAPLIIAIAYLDDPSKSIFEDLTYVEDGLIAQNVYLESAAWGLLAHWSKANTNEAAMKTALGLTDANLHPTSIITVGHSSSSRLQGNWYVNDVLITDLNQVVYATSTTVSFKFVKTAGPADTSITASVKEGTTKLLTLANSAAGTWTGSYTFITQRKHTLSLTASDGTSTVTMSALSDFVGPPMHATSISLSTTSPSSLIGFAVDINGILCDLYRQGLEGKTILLSYTFFADSTWFPITSCVTDSHGRYSVQWVPTTTGSVTIKAEWVGNNTHFGASNTTSLSTIPYRNAYVFAVESNSTISALAFNSTSLELSFTVSAETGAKGYAKATIAQSLVSSIADVKVYIDGKQTEHFATSQDGSWILAFTYVHSTHNVTVDLNPEVVDGRPSPLIYFVLAATAIALIGGIIIFRQKKRKLINTRTQFNRSYETRQLKEHHSLCRQSGRDNNIPKKGFMGQLQASS